MGPPPAVPTRLRLALAATLAALLALAWAHRFVQDDAFISFRYAQHLARGQGLTWNVGEPPVEGFTNLAWTLALGAAMKAGAEPVAASFAMGLASFAATLAGTYALTRALGGSRAAAWTATVLLGTNFTASSYATGGLETMAQACLVTWALVLALRPRPAALSVVCGALLWLRLDSALVAALLLAFVARGARADPRRLAALLLPFGALSIAIVAFKWTTFHALLPNTFYVKAGGFEARVLETGAEYVLAFLRHYGLLPYAVGVAALLPRLARGPRRVLWLPAAVVGAWTLYVIGVGGDFMEFRFVVPVLPAAFATLAAILFVAIRRGVLRGALAGAVVLCSAAHEYDTYDEDQLLDGATIETIHGLRAHLEGDGRWIAVGQAFWRAFHGDPGVTLAVGPAGAVSYYSELRTIDALGLTDAWVAHHGHLSSRRPGHRVVAPLSYLLSRGVDIGWGVDPDDPALPAGASAVVMPLEPDGETTFLYLQPSPVVDEVIQREGWHQEPVRR